MGLWAAVVLSAVAPVYAAAAATVPTTADIVDSEARRASLPPNAMPVLSSVDAWVGAMAIVILAMFAMAAVIGPVARANMPPEIPDTAGHADSHGHGAARGHDDSHGAVDARGHGH
jgi:hypothetical protein